MRTIVTEFTPFSAAVGGGMIGLSATLLWLVSGRIAGATGILSGVVFPQNRADFLWKISFIVGMVVAPMALGLFAGVTPNVVPPFGPVQVIVGGVVVGVGVTLANGCTSGHGICGLARLSRRSLASVVVFMAAGFATVFVLRHVLGGGA